VFTIYGVQRKEGKRRTIRIGTCASESDALSMIDAAKYHCDQVYAKDDEGPVQHLKVSVDMLYPSSPLDPQR
jgi:hypothetical protein